MAANTSTHETEVFGRILRQYREHAGLGQERLAEQAGLSVPTISNLERGVSRPRLETVNLLAEALALTAEQRAMLLDAALRERVAAQPSAPPVTPATSPRHNLPVPPNTLLGRETEVAAVLARMQEAATRLLTLTGVGGVGKTRLALAVGAKLLNHYPDGVWLVELAHLADPSLVPGALAEVLGLREEPSSPLAAILAERLKDRRLLLVLDNCEHLLPACAALASVLLRRCPGVRILATSRERLGVAAEQVRQVLPLSVPGPRQLPPSELVGSYEAVRLFVARAQGRRREFALREDNAQAVATICERLDGIPLALELAAARVEVLGVEAIAARLDERFRLLTVGPRDALPRQQTLQATMDWSWDLLGEGERALLGRLSVFVGGWTLAAAEAVCAGQRIEGSEVLDMLDGLASKSLLWLDTTPGEARYRLLETVRQYASERLAEVGDAALVRDRHLAWCVALAEAAEPHLLGPEQVAWLARLDLDHANLRAALRWARERGDHEQGSRLAGALGRFWELRGHMREGRDWLERLLATTEWSSVAAPLRAKVLAAAGRLAYRQGNFVRAMPLLEEGLDVARAIRDTWAIARALGNLGMATVEQADYSRATALFEESLALRRVLGDHWGIAATLNDLGTVAYHLGDYERAASLLGEGLDLTRAVGDWSLIALALHNLGWVLRAQGDHQRAVTLFEESLALRREVGDKRGIATMLRSLGHVTGTSGDEDRATALLQESLTLAQSLGDKRIMAFCLDDLAGIAFTQGQPERALRLFGAAAALREAAGIPIPSSEQANHDHIMSALGEVLGDETMAALSREGKAMTYDAAVAYALALPRPH